MSLEPHSAHWAMQHLNEGKAVSRDDRSWAGRKLFRVNKQTVNVDKKSAYHAHTTGQVIIDKHLVTIKEGVIRPYIWGTEDINSEDWTLAK